jgi:hypothetical protein
MKLSAMGIIFLLTFWVLSPNLAQTETLTSTRQLALDTKGIDELKINDGAGSLHISNTDWQNTIRVSAEIDAKNLKISAEQGAAEQNADLRLARKGICAVLISDLKQTFRPLEDARFNLLIEILRQLRIYINDDSGPIKIQYIVWSLEINNESARIDIKELIGNVLIREALN